VAMVAKIKILPLLGIEPWSTSPKPVNFTDNNEKMNTYNIQTDNLYSKIKL
jgi:hypothetical protein